MDRHGNHNADFLLHFKRVSHEKYNTEHDIRNDKFSCRISDFQKKPFYAIGYAANDIVLIVLWILATIENTSYLSVVVCFVTFLCKRYIRFYKLAENGEKTKRKTE